LPRDHLPQYLRTLRSCEVGIPNALHPASPLPLLTSKKDSNNVTTRPSAISDHKKHQRAVINNRRNMILIILPARRMPPASPQSTLERSNVGAAGKSSTERTSHNIGG
jgi:hypothetical protein